jgi:hypothetical protein
VAYATSEGENVKVEGMQYILLELVYFGHSSKVFHYSLSSMQKGVGPERG